MMLMSTKEKYSMSNHLKRFVLPLSVFFINMYTVFKIFKVSFDIKKKPHAGAHGFYKSYRSWQNNDDAK